MYGVDLAWEVGASQFGIRAVSCQPTSLRLTSLRNGPRDMNKIVINSDIAMPPKRRRAPIQEVDLAAQLNELRQMMLAQQQEIGGLRAQLAQRNQGPPDVEVPPAPVNRPAAPEIPDVDPGRTENNGPSFTRRRGKKRPNLNRTKSSKARPHNKKVKEDLRVKTITGNTAAINRKGSGMQEDRGINRIFPRRRILPIAVVIPLARNVGRNTWESVVLEMVAVFYVARKATMLKAAISILRVRRTNREDRDLNFTLHR
ncbi:hypothetical protein TIFTF001_049486 [Ficus carica]|uniref:Uncharacterized protein n=1 Tax=Ficus carica TaxID=3494 RepID=A0AA87Z304_FICCA|nr:hypothetical protein TIFTF001_049485 [Ficus carica]GMN28964.1 hypothetical protein TIFTF001_049486 [Ficus carica]